MFMNHKLHKTTVIATAAAAAAAAATTTATATATAESYSKNILQYILFF